MACVLLWGSVDAVALRCVPSDVPPENRCMRVLDNGVSRARYYNPGNGRFIQRDTFEGNNSDPQSLHKYLDAQENPVNRIGPSGHESLVSIQFSVATMGQFMTHELRTGHSILAASKRMFGADPAVSELVT